MHNDHDHANGQHHTHAAAAGFDKTEVIALLTYTLQHNQHHEDDLLSMQRQLRSLGLAEAAEQLGQCIADYDRGNVRMAALLTAIKE